MNWFRYEKSNKKKRYFDILKILIILIFLLSISISFFGKNYVHANDDVDWEHNLLMTIYENSNVHIKITSRILSERARINFLEISLPTKVNIKNFLAYDSKRKLEVEKSTDQLNKMDTFKINFGYQMKIGYEFNLEFDSDKLIAEEADNIYTLSWDWGGDLKIKQKYQIIIPPEFEYYRIDNIEPTRIQNRAIWMEAISSKDELVRWEIYFSKEGRNLLSKAEERFKKNDFNSARSWFQAAFDFYRNNSEFHAQEQNYIQQKILECDNYIYKENMKLYMTLGLIIIIIIISYFYFKMRPEGKSFFRDVSHKEPKVEWEKKEKRKCVNCGKNIPKNSTFCGHCGKEQKIPRRILKDIPPNAIDLWTHENVLQMANKGSAIMRCPGCGAYYEKSSWEYFRGCAKPECEKFAKR